MQPEMKSVMNTLIKPPDERMAIPPIEVMLHAVNCTRSILNLIKTSDNLLFDKEASTTLKVCAIGGRVLSVAFSVYETNAVLHNVSALELKQIKTAELLEKAIEFTTLIPLLATEDSLISSRKKNNRSSLASYALAAGGDMVRLVSEIHICDERQYLEMTKEEQANGKRRYDCDGQIIEGPIDPVQCQKTIDTLEIVDACSTFTNLIIESTLFSELIDQASSEEPQRQPAAAAAVYHHFENHNNQQPSPSPRLLHLLEEKRNERIDNLLSLSFIPNNLYKDDPDSIFLKFECCISLMPTRHPVQDPTAKGDRKVIYDELTILEYLDHLTKKGLKGRSPVTKLPLEAKDLIPLRAAQRLIDTKLISFQKTWGAILEKHPELKGMQTGELSEDMIANAFSEIGSDQFDTL